MSHSHAVVFRVLHTIIPPTSHGDDHIENGIEFGSIVNTSTSSVLLRFMADDLNDKIVNTHSGVVCRSEEVSTTDRCLIVIEDFVRALQPVPVSDLI